MNKPLRTIILIVLAIVVVGAGAYVLFTKKALSPTEPTLEREAAATGKEVYMNKDHGFEFTYPEGYVLTEREVGDAHRGHYQIMLVEEANAVPPEGGEGPVAVTIDVYQNNIDQQPVMQWITTTNIANIKLGDGRLAESAVGGEAAYTNTWSGLYEGKTTTFAHGDDIIAISVTWMTPEDATLEVYGEVIDSFTITSSGDTHTH